MFYVYRVENHLGEGPYSVSFTKRWQRHDHRHLRRTPTPHQEGFPVHKLKKSHIFGFRSRKQAEKWFTKRELNMLALYGFALRRVRARKIIWQSGKQIVFIRDKTRVNVTKRNQK